MSYLWIAHRLAWTNRTNFLAEFITWTVWFVGRKLSSIFHRLCFEIGWHLYAQTDQRGWPDNIQQLKVAGCLPYTTSTSSVSFWVSKASQRAKNSNFTAVCNRRLFSVEPSSTISFNDEKLENLRKSFNLCLCQEVNIMRACTSNHLDNFYLSTHEFVYWTRANTVWQ